MAPDSIELIREAFGNAWRAGWTPDPIMTVSEWADTYRQLTRDTSAEHGQWRTSRTPYAREPMDCFSATSPVRRVVLMWGAQLGKTEIFLNWIGYSIHMDPGPMMMVQPTVDVAKNVSKERIVPLVQATPVVSERVLENRARDGDNTILNKRFHGGFLKLSGANSAASLRSTPIKKLAGDEIDAYPPDVDGEGDPVTLAEARTTTFSRGKTGLSSTPTITDHSRIETEFKNSDQRRFFVPCPHCGHMDWIRWDRIVYENDDPSTVKLACGGCDVLIEERHKTWMLERGEWRPTAAGDGFTRGYHLSGLYSPLGWLSWAKVVHEWLEAQTDHALRRAFVNIRLAETYEDRAGAPPDADTLEGRREEYEADVPYGVGAVVAAVDVQADRLEYQVKGYGIGEESWLIAWGEIGGDTEQDKPWLELDEMVLREKWTHASGAKLGIECVAVDSSFRSDAAYRFTKARAGRRVYAVKGMTETGKPLVGRPSVNNQYRARLYMLCTDTGKETVTARMRIAKQGHGYMHLPSWIDREYIEQLTAEKAIWVGRKGTKAKRVWQKTRTRNEALDLEVYSLAALRILLGPHPRIALARRVARFGARKEVTGGVAASPAAGSSGTSPEVPKPAQPAKRPARNWMGRTRKGWVQGWRR